MIWPCFRSMPLNFICSYKVRFDYVYLNADTIMTHGCICRWQLINIPSGIKVVSCLCLKYAATFCVIVSTRTSMMRDVMWHSLLQVNSYNWMSQYCNQYQLGKHFSHLIASKQFLYIHKIYTGLLYIVMLLLMWFFLSRMYVIHWPIFFDLEIVIVPIK